MGPRPASRRRATLNGVNAPDPRDPLASKYGQMGALEKIEWMIETDGFAVEPVPPGPDSDPPRAGYAYTIGFPAHVGFPEVAVFGLTPVAARGLLGLVADARSRAAPRSRSTSSSSACSTTTCAAGSARSTSTNGAACSRPLRPGTGASRSRSSS